MLGTIVPWKRLRCGDLVRNPVAVIKDTALTLRQFYPGQTGPKFSYWTVWGDSRIIVNCDHWTDAYHKWEAFVMADEFTEQWSARRWAGK